MDLPFLFPDLTSAEKVLDGPVGKQLASLMPSKGIYALTFGHWGWRVTSTIDRKVQEPKDMQGIKIRVQPGPIFAAMYRALGANPIAIDFSEIYLALSQRTIEAIGTPIISLPAAKHYEVVKVVNLTNHVYNAGVLMVSKRKFDSLPPNLHASFREAASELTPDWRKTMVEKTAETTEFLKQKGLSILEVDRAAYRKQTQGDNDDFRNIIGADLFDSVIKQVEKA